jgi:hypothetical protein
MGKIYMEFGLQSTNNCDLLLFLFLVSSTSSTLSIRVIYSPVQSGNLRS